jgi:hypothetical protein
LKKYATRKDEKTPIPSNKGSNIPERISHVENITMNVIEKEIKDLATCEYAFPSFFATLSCETVT